jgi:hypothetical protein
MQEPPVGDHEARPFGYGSYTPPSTVRGRPAVIGYFRIYAITTIFLFAAFLVVWQYLTPAAPNEVPTEIHPTLRGALTVIAMGTVALAWVCLFVVGAFVPYKPWGWTVGLIVLCLGLSSCTAIAAIPLLIYWMKPETKAAFGRL